MPLYEYACATHGGFDELRPFSQSAAPCPCPQCGVASPRVISLPRVRAIDPTTLRAIDRNQRSAHEPHVCSTGCSHHTRSVVAVDAAGSPKPIAYRGPRPWVIEHPR